MICKEFSHCSCGDVGEGVLRHAMVNKLVRNGRVRLLLDDAHATHEQAKEYGGGPIFTSIRHPADFYCSLYMHRLRNRRYFGRFRNWFWEEGLVFAKEWHHYAGPTPDLERVVRFEHMENDFARILPQIWDGVSEGEVRGWFPDCYRQWSNRLWLDNIEPYLREDIYTDDIIDQVHDQDAEIFETWGYTWEEKFRPDIPAN